eukprot:COSAG03_NODE_26642_length_258_cov_0.515723_1_plen_66_part_10
MDLFQRAQTGVPTSLALLRPDLAPAAPTPLLAAAAARGEGNQPSRIRQPSSPACTGWRDRESRLSS